MNALARALVTALIVTLLVTAASALVPDRFVATAVGGIFLVAVWILVWRKDDELVIASGLALGGLVLPRRGTPKEILSSLTRAIAWGAALALITFAPFYFGWRWWWHAHGIFAFHETARGLANEALGQVVIIALPEEAFYRGYLQSELDRVWTPTWRIGGATVGPALLVTSAIFAIGHIATVREPARLAVFFPALLFGWLRARTRGIGAGVAYHASCNVFSEVLGRAFGVY